VKTVGCSGNQQEGDAAAHSDVGCCLWRLYPITFHLEFVVVATGFFFQSIMKFLLSAAMEGRSSMVN
jgi:hypothetical protein